MNYVELGIGYLLIINMITLMAYLMDKQKAKKNKWRIPERTLLLLTVVGGSIGALIGIFGIRHKSKHIKFVLGVPMIFALQLIAIIYFVMR